MNHSQARWESDLLSVRVDLQCVGRGLHEISFHGLALTDLQPLQLMLPGLQDPLRDEDLVEVYVRGTDLVASYARTEEGQFSPQLYWRGRHTAVAAGIELILSMQTDQLCGDPTLTTTSLLPAGRMLQADVEGPLRFRAVSPDSDRSEETPAGRAPSLLLFRLAACPVSYVEMVYPTDLGGFWLRGRQPKQDGWQCGYRLLQEDLEKGVIRRARMAAWLLPREEDEPMAIALFQDFLRVPLPLTT